MCLRALFTRSRYNRNFRVVERSEAFTRQIDRELITQTSGVVDNNQISRMGKQYGIKQIMVANIEYAMNSYNISARMINIETASVMNASQLYSTDNNFGGIRKISIGMVEDMIERKRTKTEIDEERKSYWGALEVGGGYDMMLELIDPAYYKGGGGHLLGSVEFFRGHMKFFRLGGVLELGWLGVVGENDIEAEIEGRNPNIDPDSISLSTFHFRIGAFAKIQPINLIYLTGGIGYDSYNVEISKNKSLGLDEIPISNKAGMIYSGGVGLEIAGLNRDKNKGWGSVFIEAQYFALQRNGGYVNYLSVNFGLKISASMYTPPEI